MSNLLKDASILLTPTGYDNGSMNAIKPENGDGDFAFSRNSAATRVNAQGLVENVQILSSNLVQNGDFSEEGSELVTNGDFATDSGWNKSSQTTISNGSANILSTDGSFQDINQSGYSSTQGKTVSITVNITDVQSGQLKVSFAGSGTNTNIPNTVGSHTIYVLNDGTIGVFSIGRVGGVTDVTIDNVSVKEVGQDWTLGTGWSIGDDKAINDGTINQSLLQTNVFTIGKFYKINFTISDVVGSLDARIWMATGGAKIGANANGDYTTYWEADGTSLYATTLSTNTATYSISNISVIEITNDTNLPRINYEGFSYDANGDIIPNSGCGSWLLEPQTTNLIPYSEDFSVSNWVKTSGATITPSYGISPSGIQNSTRLQLSTSNEQIYISAGTHSGNTEVASLYIKGVSGETIQFGVGNNIGQGSTIALDGNWQRITQESTSGTVLIIGNKDATATDFEIWGTQLEQQSKATSYIPTSGATSTRLRDIANNSGNASLINSSEGVLYAEISTLNGDSSSNRTISLSDSTTGNQIRFYFPINIEGAIISRVDVGGSTIYVFNYSITTSENPIKIAFRYSSNGMDFYVNGSLVSSSALVPSFTNNLNSLQFRRGDGSAGEDFYGKNKALAVYKTALTDAQLTALTTI